MFATVQQVKTLDGSFRSTADDNELAEVVNGVNYKMEDYLDRHLIIDDYVDVFNVYPTMSATFKLKGYPVNSVAEVKLDGSILSSDMYLLNEAKGYLQLLYEPIVGLSKLEVSYNGGMAVDEATLRASYPSIVYATNMQVIFEFKRKGKLAHSSMTITKGGSEGLIEYKLLDEVKRAVRKYRRKTLVV